FQRFYGRLNSSAGIIPEPLEVFPGQTDFEALHALFHGGKIVIDRSKCRSRISVVMSRHCFEYARRILHIAPERTDMVEGTGEGNQPITRYASISWCDAYDTAKTGRLADRSAR